MTDRELLELAAKAAGIEHVTPMMVEWRKWNPLDDDGDALRLATKLRLNMLFPTAVGKDEIHVNGLNCHKEKLFNDPYAATRRAIVRAAAEIGRAMK